MSEQPSKPSGVQVPDTKITELNAGKSPDEGHRILNREIPPISIRVVNINPLPDPPPKEKKSSN